MIEIINIFIFPLVLIIFLQNNLLSRFLNNNYGKKILFLDQKILNLFILLNLILIISLLNLKIEITIYLVVVYFLLTNFLFFSFKKNFFFIYNFLFLIIIFYIFSVQIAAYPDLSWDGKFHWYKRALNFFQDMGFENLSSLPKYEYPHFGSYIWALFWSTSLLKLEYFGRLFYLFLYLLSIYSICDLVINQKIKNLSFIFFSLIAFNLNHFTGNQDIVVFSLIIFLTRYFYLIYIDKDDKILNYLLFILINNIIIWIKYECFVYVFLSYIILITSKFLNKKFDKVYFLTLFLFITILFKISISKIYQINLDASFQFSGEYNFKELFYLENIIYKFFFIIKYYLFSLFKNPILLLGFFSLVIILFKRISLLTPMFIFFILLNLSTFSIFYIIQSDFEWHVVYGIDRYMLQYSGVSILFIIILLNNLFRNK